MYATVCQFKESIYDTRETKGIASLCSIIRKKSALFTGKGLVAKGNYSSSALALEIIFPSKKVNFSFMWTPYVNDKYVDIDVDKPM